MRKLLLPLIFILLATACKKNAVQNVPTVGGWFEIEIKATSNPDCHFPEIAFLTGQNEAYSILGDSRRVYIALGLPKVLYPAGAKLLVHIRKPLASEDVHCTSQGISWAHAFITEIQ